MSPSRPKTDEALDGGMGHPKPGIGEGWGDEGISSFCSCSWKEVVLRASESQLLDWGLWVGASAEWVQALGSIKIQKQQHLPKQSRQCSLYLYGFVPVFSLHFCFPRNIRQCLEMFWVSQVGCGCSWHLEGKSQGCCKIPYNTQDIPLQKIVLLPQMCIEPCRRSPPQRIYSQVT